VRHDARTFSTLAALTIALSFASTAAVAQHTASDRLQANFDNPPQDAKLRCYWWWLNGYTTTATITRDLTEMKARGYAGVILVDAYSGDSKGAPVGPHYGSPAWMKLYLHALQTTANLGMEVSLSITDGGNVGILGSGGVKPAEALKTLTFTRTDVHGGADLTLPLASPPITNGFYQPIAVLAYPLRHGDALAGERGSGRQAIKNLAIKAAFHEGNFSMPRPETSVGDAPSVAGEEDTELRDVVDLSADTSADGTLHWRFPFGDWEVLRIGYTDSFVVSLHPGGNELGVDALDTQAFDLYWNRVVAPVLDAGKPYIGKSLRYLVTDSWEADATNWTGDFRQQFLKRRGYDPIPYLPAVTGRILSSRDTTNRFLADLRRTVADLIAENYYDHFAARAAEYHLGIHPEAGGPHSGPLDALRNFRDAALPQTEFWAASPEHRVSNEDRFFVKEAASAAHIYGKQFVAAEGFSCMGPPWAESPSRNLKPTFDLALTEGLNRLFWHESTSVPIEEGKPGDEYFAGTHLNANTTWWNQAAPVLHALNRAQYLMQQGEPVADLLYYYGEQVPQFARLKSDDPAHVLPGYDYDVTDEDALEHRMIATAGDLHTPEGIHYRALALPYSRSLSLPALRWVEAYVRDGGIAIGLEPLSPLGIIPATQAAEYKRIADTMWQSCDASESASSVRYGKGKIFCTQNSRAAFAAMHIVPDFTYSATDPSVSLDYIHRRTATADIYFIRNANDAPAQATLSFRVHGRTPEFWNMDSGERTPALVYRDSGEQTEIPASLPAHGSTFLVFERPTHLHAVKLERDGQEVFPSIISGEGIYGSTQGAATIRLDTAEPGDYTLQFSNGGYRLFQVVAATAQPQLHGPWTLAFPAGWGAPAAIALDHLQSWTESRDPGIRYFSGTATYTNTIDFTAALLASRHEVWINLGDAREVVTVAVNGKDIRTLWHGPFTVRIDPALHAGSNALSIRVTNLWPNRLIGDKQPNAKAHYTQTNVNNYTADSPLMPSGLLTPVTFDVFSSQPVQ
jgi:hypothetical protein